MEKAWVRHLEWQKRKLKHEENRIRWEGKGKVKIEVRGGVAGKEEGSSEGEKGGKIQRIKEEAEAK